MDRRSALWAGGGVGVGLGLMYLLDPSNGRRRRALVRDKTIKGLKTTGHAIGTASRGVAKGAKGVALGARAVTMTVISPLRKPERPVSDDVLVHRVRTRMGRVVSHPRAIEVSASNGNVTLSGPVLKSELDHLLSCVSKIRGVKGVENRMDVRERHEGELAAGEMHRSGWRRALVPTGVLAGATGSALAYHGVMYARDKMKPPRHRIISSAMNMIPFVKHNHVSWWKRPFA